MPKFIISGFRMQQSLQCTLYENLCCLYLDINDCMPNPFENGGSCTDGVNEYNCSCASGYTGTDCERSEQLKILL